MAKSHVGMGAMTCPVCGREHSESVLLHKQLKEVFPDSSNQKVHTGYELCPEDKEKHEQGYVALIEVDPSKSDINKGVFYRTGDMAHMRRDAAKEVFVGQDVSMPIMHVEIGILEKLRESAVSDDE